MRPAADFANPAPSFELSLALTVYKYLNLNRAASRTWPFFARVTPIAGFENTLHCTATPQYPGVIMEFEQMPAPPIEWPVKLNVTATPAAAAGPAPVTVECTGRGITRSVTFQFQLQ